MAQKSTDILLNSNGDFPLEDTYINGVIQDTPVGFSDQQHIQDNIEYSEGSLVFDPLIGFGVKRFLNSEYRLNDVFKQLKEKLELDGYEVKSGCVYPSGGGFNIDTSYIVPK